MAWVLEVQGPRTTTPTVSLQLLPGTSQVGRAQTAQIRSTHQSVSRVHAEIVVKPAAGSLSEVLPLEISILDRSSTGHTFVNEQQPGKGHPQRLCAGDVLHFGVDPLRYKLSWRPMLMSISSRLAASELQSLQDKARGIGVFLTPEWSAQCTHLLLDQFAITPKLLCCIIDGALPVSMLFLSEMSRRVNENCELLPTPAAAEFAPKAAAGPDAEYASGLGAYVKQPLPRRELFRGIWVIFSAKPVYDTLSTALSCAGSPIQILTQDQSVSSVLQDLRKASSKGPPTEVWIIPTLPAGLGALAKPLQDLRCPCRMVSQKALVGAIIAGTIKDIRETAVLPKSELQAESFPDTQPTSAPCQPQARGKRQLAMDSKPAVQVKEESFPNTFQDIAPGQPEAKQEVAEKKAKTEHEEQEQAEERERHETQKRQQEPQKKDAHAMPPPSLQGSATRPGARPASQNPTVAASQTAQPASQRRETERPEAASLQTIQAVLVQPKQEDREAKVDISTVHSSAASLPRAPEVKVEEPQVLREDPQIHPTNTWLPQLAQKGGRGLVVDGVELPRATWFTTTKRRAETPQQAAGKPNFKRFRKVQRTEARPVVRCVPWAPPRNLELFTSQPSMETESQIPRLAI